MVSSWWRICPTWSNNVTACKSLLRRMHAWWEIPCSHRNHAELRAEGEKGTTLIRYPSRWNKPWSSCPKNRTEGWSGCRPWWRNTASWSECFDPAGLRSDDDGCPRCWLRRKKKRKAHVKNIPTQLTVYVFQRRELALRRHLGCEANSAKTICERKHKTSRMLSLRDFTFSGRVKQ